MKIVIVGAGAIGSLYGALLAQKNTVVLVGRAPHITSINHKGLTIRGITRMNVNIPAVESVDAVSISPDLIFLTVKSYDTEEAIKQLRPLINKNTALLSLQNGLDNIEKIQRFVDKRHLLAGVSLHGAILSKPGEIIHTGVGNTILGEIDSPQTKRLKIIVQSFSEVGIKTQISDNIRREIWIKAIINSSINPITAFLGCKNGYLLENPLLEQMVERVCTESTTIASSEGVSVSLPEMIAKTQEVIRDTAQNYSSMLQSVQHGKNTEIDSINGVLMRQGRKNNINSPLNQILLELIVSLPASQKN